MPTRRVNVRRSLLALIVSFLRDATTDTTNFTYVVGVTSAYPFTQDTWMFALGSELYPITVLEQAWKPLLLGVTIQFGTDSAEESHSMPQNMSERIRMVIRVPRMIVGESHAQQIARKIDQALYRCNGKCEIKDYSVSPAVSTSTFLNWQALPRGAWVVEDAGTPLEQLTLDMTAEYPQPKSEWE